MIGMRGVKLEKPDRLYAVHKGRRLPVLDRRHWHGLNDWITPAYDPDADQWVELLLELDENGAALLAEDVEELVGGKFVRTKIPVFVGLYNVEVIAAVRGGLHLRLTIPEKGPKT